MRKELFRFTVFTAWGLALLALAGAASAQVQLDTQAAAPPDEIPLAVSNGVLELSLNDTVEMALRRNLGLVIERYTRSRARLGVQQELGLYDLLGTATLQMRDQSSAGATRFQSSETVNQSLNIDFDQIIPTGGTFSLGFSGARSESDGDPVSPFYRAGMTFNFVQPLLRNRGVLATERQLLIAQTQSLVSSQEFSRQVMATLQQVTDAYWALVGARDQLVVAQESLGLATELHERNRIQVEVGTMAPLELVQSEAAIATREEDIIRSQQAVGDTEDALRQLLNLPQGPLWDAEIRPATAPEVEAPAIDVAAAIRTALESRPEVRAQQLAVEQTRIDSAYFRNQKLPALDLTLNYGLGGSNITIIGFDQAGNPILANGAFSEALEQIAGIDVDGWAASLILAYPLQNRAARAASAIADLDVERAETALAQTEQQVTTEVRQAARQVDSAAKQIDAARASVRFQELTLDAEKKRYENGMSSSFNITRIQQDVTAAKSRQVSAVIAYRTALTQLQQATGQLLPEYNIVIDDPEAPVDRWDFSLFGRGR